MNSISDLPNTYTASQKINIIKNFQNHLISTKKDYWFSLGMGFYLIPLNTFIIVYIITSNNRRIYLINNKIEDIFKHKNVIKFLKLNLPISDLVIRNNLINKRKVFNQFYSGHTFNLMLSLTTNCHLKCSYCYINGGSENKFMSWDVAKKSIDFEIDNCIRFGIKKCRLAFHGQGEPTISWNMLTKTVIYYIEQCKKNYLDYEISLTTNGVLNETKIKFLKKHKVFICISMDCSSNTLNKLRPLRNGSNILPILNNTLRILRNVKYEFTIRSTITDLNVNEMSGFINFLSQFKLCKSVHFEPIEFSGRATNYKVDDNFYNNFISNFIKAKQEGIENGVDVGYSGSQLFNRNHKFCSAIGESLNFCVSTDGIVSSCYEHLNDNINNPFIYGKYVEGSFKIFKTKYNQLLNKQPVRDFCSNCFLVNTCCGDCHSRIFSYKSKNNPRCFISREIAKTDLFLLSLKNIFDKTKNNKLI